MILGLAFCDTLTILCSLATRGFPFLGIDSLEFFGSIIVPIAFPMAVTWFTGSVYTTMLLSFERYSGIVLGKRIYFKKVYHYMVYIGLFSIITNTTFLKFQMGTSWIESRCVLQKDFSICCPYVATCHPKIPCADTFLNFHQLLYCERGKKFISSLMSWVKVFVLDLYCACLLRFKIVL